MKKKVRRNGERVDGIAESSQRKRVLVDMNVRSGRYTRGAGAQPWRHSASPGKLLFVCPRRIRVMVQSVEVTEASQV